MRMLEFHIEVADVEAALEFYQQLLPYEKITRWGDGSAVALVMPDGAAFGIWKKGKIGLFDGRGGAHLHFAFQIEPDEYEHYKQRLLDLGHSPEEHVWPSGQRSLYFFDDDGHQGEFMTCDWFGLSATDSASGNK